MIMLIAKRPTWAFLWSARPNTGSFSMFGSTGSYGVRLPQ